MVEQTKTRMVNVCDWEMKTKTVDQTIVECVPTEKTRTRKVCTYKPETRTRKRKVCDWKTETRQVVYKVRECRTEQREKTFNVTEYHTETRSKEVECVRLVPKAKMKTQTITVNKCVPVQIERECTVMVPHQAQKEVQVRRCVLVPKKVKVTVCSTGCSTGCK